MKKFFKIVILVLIVNTSLLSIPEKTAAQQVSFQVFYDDLSPYGNWIESPDYGYVWCPRVSGFAPYSTNGYWILTDYGWTWVSDYSWGWAPFHYGRWSYDPIYGYIWVPGYEWGPGWVTWRRSDDYYGWAPIGPGVSISLAYSNGYNIPYNHWNFVRCHDFGTRNLHYLDRSKNVTIINNTTVINTTKVDNTRKTTFSPGPDRMEVQKKAGRTFNPVAIVDEKKPVQRVTKNSVQLYRPVVENNASDNAKKPAPAKLTPLSEMKEHPNAATRRETQAVREDNDQKNEPTQPSKPIRDGKQSPQVKQAPVKEPVRDDHNTAPVKQQPVKQQPVRKPIRDEQPVQPQKENQQPVQRPVQQHPDNQKNVDQPKQQRTEPQQRPVERPVQQRPDNQRNVDQPRQQRPEPQQRPVERPVRQQPVRQARPSKDGKG